MLDGDIRSRRVVVLAGRGGNGGGGLVAARRLFIWGANVSVVLAQHPEDMSGVPHQQLTILERIGVPVIAAPPRLPSADALARADLVLDALIGYSLRGAPREPTASVIRTANASARPILALDVPSGLDADSGVATEPTICATATLTLALPKVGLLAPSAQAWTGQLDLADISVPPAAYRHVGIDVGPIFARSDIIPLAKPGPSPQPPAPDKVGKPSR